MLKPDSEDGKSTKGSSSSWVNCLGMTLLVISLTMAVAALWIPWERLNKLDRMTKENKDNFEQLQRLILQINGTSTSDSLSVKAELLKSVSLGLERDILVENNNIQELVWRMNKVERSLKFAKSLLVFLISANKAKKIFARIWQKICSNFTNKYLQLPCIAGSMHC